MRIKQKINQSLVGHGDGNYNNKMNKLFLNLLKKNIKKDKLTKLKLFFK